MRQTRIVLALLACLLASACSEQVLHADLDEDRANRIVALMYAQGLPATKSRTTDGSYSVSTDQDSFAAAVELLRANGLPGSDYDSLGDVFAKEGFVSSPLEERARLNHALSQEIARTLSSIDGVVMARVHLAVPERDELRDTRPPASASVFIKHRANVDLTDSVSQIKALVVNGIEHMPYDNVTVALFEAEPMDVRAGPAPARELAGVGASFGAMGGPVAGVMPALSVLLAAVGTLVIGLALWRRRPRTTGSVPDER